MVQAVGRGDYKTKVQQIADDNEAARTKARAQVQALINQTPAPISDTAEWAGIGGDVVKGGLKIGDAFGVFDKKKADPTVTPKAGATYGTEFEV